MPRSVESVIVDILDALSALSNADGGELIVGIEDDGLATGVPHPESHVRAMCAAPTDTNGGLPKLDPEVRIVDLPDGERLLHFSVGSTTQVHRLGDGRCLLRIRDTNIPLSHRQVQGLLQTMQQRQDERIVVEGARLTDLDFALISELFGEGDIEAQLHRLGLIVSADGEWVPRLAALLLFGLSPSRWHAGLVFRKWGEDESGDPDLEQVFFGPLATLPKRVFEFVRMHLPSRNRFPFGAVPVYPEGVWQEAIINAIQ